jgi:hypothetical protein
VSVLAPDPRERRTIALGGAVVVVAFLVSTVILPTVTRWRDREALIDALQRQRSQLIALGAHRPALEVALAERRAALEALPVRLISGRTSALAASVLQSVLQDYASASRVSVSRLDVASAADSMAAGVPAIPATLAAVSDIYGLADFLSRVELGGRLLEVTELSVSPNPALRGDLLQMSLVVRAPFVLTP